MQNYFKDAYKGLYQWIEKESFCGYDPYDALNTNVTWLKNTKKVRIFLTYVNKFSPVNFRKLLGIKKTKDNKALALIILSLLKGPRMKEQERVIEKHVDYLLSTSLVREYGHHCWNAHNFYVQTKREYQSPRMPGVIGTEVCASALLEYYRRHQNRSDIKDVIVSTRDFFLNVLLVRNENGVFFKYKPMSPDHECIYNASIIAASFVARVNQLFNLNDGETTVGDCYDFLLERQNKDGSWNYGIDLRTRKEKRQIDFHQGFILDALLDYLNTSGYRHTLCAAYRNGLQFYFSKQFFPNGQSIYRYPRKYPVDIHNQSQGIITFSKAGKFDPRYARFAQIIGDWTMRNMQSNSGFFYYMKYPLITNKVPYLRWSQAWMLYALSHLKNV